ncbi:GNAT family N-acetyltransferase [Micromonospora rifamycinica]|uniref:GNAT family N-acetyltransferase n=1 Tax=Micromonospora rifamycinica TaxID=291594 RepID=UPI002E2846E8|nr:GNAT family N-acetyltransferase [Micromonospora rifamycinica]
MNTRSVAFSWQNSTRPWVVGVHHTVDAVRHRRPRATESVPADAGPALAYAGLTEGLDHVLPFLEQQRGPTGRRRRQLTSWADIFSGRAVPAADILAAGCLPGRVPSGPVPRSLTLPLRITLVVPLGEDAAGVLRRVSRKARQQHARELRSRSRSLEVATLDQDFALFYDRMHLPTMQRRHASATRSVSRATAHQCLFRGGVLFFLQESGERVAGMLCRQEGNGLVIRLAGVRDGAEEPYRSGTYMAIYILILQWAADQGLARVDLSGCEPFLSKGIFQFKRKLHPEVTLPRNHFAGKRLWLHVRRDTPPVRDFLAANPMLVTVPGGGLEAVYFHDAHRPPRTDLRWETPGVHGHRMVDLDAFMAGEPLAGPTAGPSPLDGVRPDGTW